MIEGQPGDAAVFSGQLQAMPGDRAGVARQRPLADQNATRKTGAAGGELNVAWLLGAQRLQIPPCSGQSRNSSMRPDQGCRRSGGSSPQGPDQIGRSDRNLRLGHADHPGQPLLICRAATEVHAQRQGHRNQARILASEEKDQELGGGVGNDRQPECRVGAPTGSGDEPYRSRGPGARGKAASAPARPGRRRSCSRSVPRLRSQGQRPSCQNHRYGTTKPNSCSAWDSSGHLSTTYQPAPNPRNRGTATSTPRLQT